jgi:hypothetical protein
MSWSPLFQETVVEVQFTKEIIPLNIGPLLEIERRSLEKLLKQIARLESEIDEYFSVSRPAFFDWFQRNYAERVLKARALEREMAFLHRWVSGVRTEAALRGFPEREVFHHIKPLSDSVDQSHGRPFSWEPLPLTRERIVGSTVSRSQERRARDVQPIGDADQRRAREIYLDLARRMHPDQNPDLSDRMRELWFDVQEAWEARDLEALEFLEARAMAGDREWPVLRMRSYLGRVATLSGARRLSKEFKKRILDLQSQISEIKKDLAWKFAEIRESPARLKKLETRIATESADTIRVLEQGTAEHQAKIQEWGKPADLPNLP